MSYNPIIRFKRLGFKRLKLKNLYYRVWFKERRGEARSEIMLNDEFKLLGFENMLRDTVVYDTLMEYKELVGKMAKREEDQRLGVVGI